MNRRWKTFLFAASLAVNAAVLAGYVYGAVNPRVVQGSPRPVPPGLRDPNLTQDQIQAIRRIQVARRAWFNSWEDKYQSQVIEIIDLLDNRKPDWAAVNALRDRLRDLRGEYYNTQFHGWSDINQVLTPEQGRQYLEALRQNVRVTNHTGAPRLR